MVLAANRRETAGDLILIDQHRPASFRMALRNRFAAAELEARVAAVRSWFRRRGELHLDGGHSFHAADFAERLLTAGASPAADDPEMAAMVMTEAPPSVDSVEIRASTTFADSLIARDLVAELNAVPPDQVPSEARCVESGEQPAQPTG